MNTLNKRTSSKEALSQEALEETTRAFSKKGEFAKTFLDTEICLIPYLNKPVHPYESHNLRACQFSFSLFS